MLVSLLAVVGTLALDVRSRLANLKSSDSDSGQWVMSQTEVEVLRLQHALSGDRSDQERLEDVRRWFDVVYSRLALLHQSPLYQSFLQGSEHQARLAVMQSFVDRWLPVIDGPDDALLAALPEMESENAEVQRMARSLSLKALLAFSAHTDETRARVSETLIRLAIATAATFLLLGLLAIMAMRLYRLTERQAEENQITGARLQMIIATSPDAIVVTNRGGWVVEINPAAERMFGITRAQAMGNRIVPMIFSPENVPQHQARITQMIADAVFFGPQRFEVEGRRSDGTVFPLEISLAMRDLNRGALVVGFMRDVSERHADRRALEKALEQAKAGAKTKADFLAVMSHEMRTPLNGLIGSMELLHDTPMTAGQRELLRVMDVSGDILLGHVNSVLDISRHEAGGIRLADTPFNLDRLIEDCIANQAGVARTGGNTIRHVPLTGPLGTVRGDPARVQQILLNLIGNAVKFTRKGAITVETERQIPRAGDPAASLIEFRVIDTGIGIAEADLARVFDDFETVDSGYARETTGTGLGLGIARRLTQAMGGEIGAESDLGKGSVFWLRLPLPPTEALPDLDPCIGRPRKHSAPPQASRQILVIEDNEINRFLLRRYLQDAGHRVCEAADGVDGVAAAQATRFDLIITDIAMPRLDGIEATRRIRASGASSQARIIALTAHALPEDLQRLRLAGVDACLIKPVTREVLLAELFLDTDPAAPRHSKAPYPPLDTAPLMEMAERLGKPMVTRLVQRMLADGDDTIARIAAQPGPTDEVARIAHQLAGSCATFGATRLREVLLGIEQAIRRGDTACATRLTGALAGLWADTRAALADHAHATVA
ncbi:MAG: response regulator [Rhodobacteraceae bacterium]|nr:response regulator [Paracoccaceae bacterium]